MSKILDNKKTLYLIILIILIGIILPISYSIYSDRVNVKVTTKVGEACSDFEVITNDKYVDDNGKYFYVNVTNYEKKGNVIYLTDVDMSYKLIISNKSESDITYSYQNSTGNKIEITGEFSNKEKENNKYKIYVNNNSIEKVKANINVKLEANQKI